jgi:hypothetical protein
LIGYLSEANDGSEPYPELAPKIAFAPPVLVPIRSRAEGNVDVTDRFSVQAGAEIGLCFLLF